MTKTRTDIPKATREKVLAEYSHHCAICNHQDPQIHHIDGDPSNHDIVNLLPLCSNCHLTDVHNPFKKINQGIVRLFRIYKDPFILEPQFQPIYARIATLPASEGDDSGAEWKRRIKELVEFVKYLEMGEFYSKQINDIAVYHPPAGISSYNSMTGKSSHSISKETFHEHEARFCEQRDQLKEQIINLVMEQLRYQKWNTKSDKK